MSSLSKTLSKPPIWSAQTNEVEEIELPASSSEYRQIRSTLSGDSLSHLQKITRVQNPYLYHRYNLRKLEYQVLGIPFTERQLVHATAASKISSIIKDNLDWRLVSRAKFGQGVSFSTCSSYANKYCARANGDERAMIVAKVLVGRKRQGTSSMTVTPKGFDTAVGNGEKVFVKFYDDEFYPAYVAYYKNTSRVNHHRYNVYDDLDMFDIYDDGPSYDDLDMFDIYDNGGSYDDFDYDFD